MDAAAALHALRTAEGRRNPYPHYAVLHAQGPVAELDGKPYSAIVHGYDAVMEVLRDPRFQVLDAQRLTAAKPGWPEHRSLRLLMGSMMFTNGPQHARKRRLVTQTFTARRVASLTADIGDIVDGLLDTMADLGADGSPVDFMGEFAYPLPSNVIGALLGIPPADRAWFRPHVIAIGAVLDAGGPEKYTAGDLAADELARYFTDLVRSRRAAPRDDLVSTLTQAHDADEHLTDDDLLCTLVLLFNAGFETTTHLLGNGLHLLLGDPAAMADLRARPDRVAGYTEEFLRLESPGQLTTRWTDVDVDLHGVRIPAGSTVLVLLGAANRDPFHFPDPDTLDPDRPESHPLAFSGGAHFCPGAILTRAEAHLAFPRLLARFPRLAAAGEPTFRDQLTLRGHTRLPVTVA